MGSFREVEMVNWTALLGLEKGVKVRKTTKHWIVHVETLYGHSPAELTTLALNLANRVAKSLMLKYGCVLSEPKFGRGSQFGIDDPVAKLLSRYFTVSTSKREMDHSPGELQGEIDHLGRDAAIEYLLMPERVKKLDAQVLALSSQVDDLSHDLRNLVDVLQKTMKARNGTTIPSHILNREPLGVS